MAQDNCEACKKGFYALKKKKTLFVIFASYCDKFDRPQIINFNSNEYKLDQS